MKQIALQRLVQGGKAAAWNLLGVIAKRLPRFVRKLIPLRLKEAARRIVSHRELPSPVHYSPAGVRVANSSEDKIKEIEASKTIWGDEVLYRCDVRHPYLQQKISPFLPLLDNLALTRNNLVIVDAGAGWGSLLNLVMSRHRAHIGIGFDLSPEACRMAHSQSLGSYFQADAENIPLEDECADIVMHMSTLHHFFRYPQRVLREAWRILKPGGYLLVNDPNPCKEAPEIHAKVEELRKHIVKTFDIVADLLGDKGKPQARWGEPKAQVVTEAAMAPGIIQQSIQEAGFSVVDMGYVMLVTTKVIDYPFGFHIAEELDDILRPVVPKECDQVWFIGQKQGST